MQYYFFYAIYFSFFIFIKNIALISKNTYFTLHYYHLISIIKFLIIQNWITKFFLDKYCDLHTLNILYIIRYVFFQYLFNITFNYILYSVINIYSILDIMLNVMLFLIHHSLVKFFLTLFGKCKIKSTIFLIAKAILLYLCFNLLFPY